jgi:hypothetical protein
MTFPETDLSGTHQADHIAHHVAAHDLHNELVVDGSKGDTLAKAVAGTSTATVGSRQSAGAAAAQVLTVTHSSAGGLYIGGLTRAHRAIKINATAAITELRVQDLWQQGPLATEVPVLLTNTSGSTIAINLNGVQVSNPPPATLTAGAGWVFWITRIPHLAAFQVVDYYESFATVGPGATVLSSTFWEIYDGAGNAGWGRRRPSAVAVVADGSATDGPNVLRITASNGTGGDAGFLVSGGVKLLVPQIYGQIELRVRVSDDADQVTSGVVILWPKLGPAWPSYGLEWPAGGELDIWEGFANRATRTPAESYIHRLNPAATPPYDAADDQVQGFTWTGVDGSAWHKLVYTWLPDRLSLSIDNGTDVVLTTDRAWIPDWPMELTLQFDAWDAPGAPGVQPAVTAARTMDIDYVLIRQFT